jgi:hypothetical protein
LGIIVIPFLWTSYTEDELMKRTMEVNFPPATVMAYGVITSVTFNDWLYYAIGIKRVRIRKSNGTDMTMTLGNGSDAWPRAYTGNNVTSVTFAIALQTDIRLDGNLIVHLL